MRHYDVVVSDEALKDVDQVYEYICNELYAQMTAAAYYDGLIKSMSSLRISAGSHAIEPKLSVVYGKPIRRINYKNFAILYFIDCDEAVIHRVIPQSLIL